MNNKIISLGILLCLAFSFIACEEEEQKSEEIGLTNDEESHLLIFSKTAGFRHESIDVAVPALTKYAEDRGVSVHATEDASLFKDDSLARFDAVVFVSTTGPLFTDEQQAAFERFIRNGGGFAGIHGSSDTQGPDDDDGPNDSWQWYGNLIGAYFHSHPEQQEARLIVTESGHLSTNMLDAEWIKFDEWYNFWELPDHVNVLLELDTESYQGSKHSGEHPIAWYHEFDGGRSFYTGLGHTDESCTENDQFMQHVWGGIQYAMGK